MVDNVWKASDKTTLFNSEDYNADTLVNKINWTDVAVNGVIGAVGAGVGTIASKVASPILSGCAGTLCRVGVTASVGFITGSTTRLFGNIIQGKPCSSIFDGVIESGIFGGTISVAAYGGQSLIKSLRLPSPSKLAEDVANETGGVLKPAKNDAGYVVTVPNGSRNIVIRIMESGGPNTNYYRVAIEGMPAVTVGGEFSNIPELTHFNIETNSFNDIINIVNKLLKN